MNTTTQLGPFGVGELLDRAIRVYRAQFLTFVGIVALALIPTTILRIISLANFGTGQLVDLVQQFFVQNLASAALTGAVAHAYLWQPLTIADAYRLGIRRYGALLGAFILMGLAVGAPAIILGLCTVTTGMFIIPMLIVVPVASYLGTRWGVVIPSIILEDMSVTEGLMRSWDLTNGYFWRVLGMFLLTGLLTTVVAELPGMAIAYGIEYVLPFSAMFVRAVLLTAVDQISLIITLPLSVGVTTLLYYDLRVRKEGYDLELRAEAVVPSVQPSV